jgi:hypothetical protein
LQGNEIDREGYCGEGEQEIDAKRCVKCFIAEFSMALALMKTEKLPHILYNIDNEAVHLRSTLFTIISIITSNVPSVPYPSAISDPNIVVLHELRF